MHLAQAKEFSIFGSTFRGAHLIRSPELEDAKRHLVRSYLLATALPLILLAAMVWSGLNLRTAALITLLSASIAWASYWGVVAVANALTDHSDKIVGKVAVHATYHFGIYALVLPVLAGVLYGTLGGCALEFLKWRRLHRNAGSLEPRA